MIAKDLVPTSGANCFGIMGMTPCAGTDVDAGALVTAAGLLVRPDEQGRT
jgi:hypothetical protein